VSATSVLQMDWPESISAPRLANPGCGPAPAVLTCWASAQNARIWIPTVSIPPEPIPAHSGGSTCGAYQNWLRCVAVTDLAQDKSCPVGLDYWILPQWTSRLGSPLRPAGVGWLTLTGLLLI
jgi:hypothetical protein